MALRGELTLFPCDRDAVQRLNILEADYETGSHALGRYLRRSMRQHVLRSDDARPPDGKTLQSMRLRRIGQYHLW